MKASPAVRSLRAAVFAALCVLLATGGHALATGMAPPVWAQAAGFVPMFVTGWLLGGRERSLGAIGGATLTSQGGLHLAFGAARPRSMGTPYGMAMHHMSATHTMTMHGVRMAHTAAPHSHALTPHATAAHVSAALLLTWWLRRGEAALWSLLRRAVTLVPGLAAWWRGYGEPVAPDPVRPPADGPCAPRPLLLRHTVHRRGPPTTISYAI
ncbi:hypothetical protein [Streptomyces canus]|uniref:hypothetical protein n=1 Tax=Streptomyces canus TaxID=58343 RepID=UPI0027847688|nr:hypothetical protein [Streptomyces canus]MDQ1067048.1 hypothetical protein [Streptomyces canus]